MKCVTVGISGGCWAHYVGLETLRLQTGWTMLIFALDWVRPPRQTKGTSTSGVTRSPTCPNCCRRRLIRRPVAAT